MSAYRSTADLARNDPPAYERLGNCVEQFDDDELVIIQPEPVHKTPTAADIAQMHAERPSDLDRVLARFAALAAGFEALADHVDATSPQARRNAYAWAAAQVRRVLADVIK